MLSSKIVRIGIAVIAVMLTIQASAAPPRIPGNNQRDWTSAEQQVVQADNSLGFNIFSKLINRESFRENVAISPLNIAMTLTMAYNGANGETRRAMSNVLGLNGLSLEQTNQACREVNDYLPSFDPEIELELANSIWLSQAINLNKAFRQISEEYFAAGVQSLNFYNPKSVNIINRWVSDNTGGMVNNILDEIPPGVVMNLINALYFKGVWTFPFDVSKTREAPFKLPYGAQITCDMMTSQLIKMSYFYEPDLKFHMVEVPYGDGLFAMTIILPEQGQKLENVIDILDNVLWNKWISEMSTTEVILHLPRFRLESEFLMNDALKTMGMGIAFDPHQADFSKMAESGDRHLWKDKNLWISRVIHKAVIEIDEKGTEAGAGAVVEFKKMYSPQTLIVDRPFLFAIREITSGSIVFLAKMDNPNKQ